MGLYQQGLELPALQRQLHGLGQQAHIRHQRAGLLLRVVLPEGHKIIVPPVEQLSQIPGVGAQSVVGGHGQHHRPGVAQMRLAGKGHGRVGNAVGQLCQRVARTRGDDQQIQQLEQSLGCELFDRSTRPVSLTSAGSAFLQDAKAILERMSRAQERVHDAATGLTGTLHVGYVRGYERSDLSTLMRHFHQKNSNVLISFYRCSTDVLAAGLLHQEYDIVFTWDSTNLRTQEGVAFQTVEKARLVVALYAGHRLAQRRQITRQELRGENILYMSPDAAPDSYGDAFFMQRYVEAGYKPNILFRSADTESILMMVSAEEGVSLLPDYCTNRLYNADNLVFVPLVGEGEEEEIIAAWQSGNQNPALGRFLAELNQKDPPQ